MENRSAKFDIDGYTDEVLFQYGVVRLPFDYLGKLWTGEEKEFWFRGSERHELHRIAYTYYPEAIGKYSYVPYPTPWLVDERGAITNPRACTHERQKHRFEAPSWIYHELPNG